LFVLVFSTFVTDDAMMIFNQARAICRKFAFVHIASAQFELDRGTCKNSQGYVPLNFVWYSWQM